MISINILHEHYTFTSLAVIENLRNDRVISVDLKTFLRQNDNRYPFEDDTKEPKIDLPSFGRCLENRKGLESITVQAKSSQRPLIKII